VKKVISLAYNFLRKCKIVNIFSKSKDSTQSKKKKYPRTTIIVKTNKKERENGEQSKTNGTK